MFCRLYALNFLFVLTVPLCLFAGLGLAPQAALADVYVTGFFNGQVDRFDEQTKAKSVFATIPGNPGLSGVTYNRTNHRFYVSALNHGSIYELDGSSGNITGAHLVFFGPGGITVSPEGQVVVTDFTSNLVRFYDPSDFSAPSSTIGIPAPSVTAGVGYLPNGTLLIATAGAGVFQYDGKQVTPFTKDPFAQGAAGQIAADASNVFFGHGLGFSDSVLRFTHGGQLTGAITITDGMLGGTGSGSSPGTGPSGVAFDAYGNLYVAVLGRSNPSDPDGERGGLFKYGVGGTLLESFNPEPPDFAPAYSSVVVVNPTVNDTFVYHNGWTGDGSPADVGKKLYREGSTTQSLTYDNLINTSHGINGIGFKIGNVANPKSLSANDFEFRFSPQGAFALSENPPSSWELAPNPGSMDLTPGSPDQVVFTWDNFLISNRWLRVTVKATPNTGLVVPEVFYLGHLNGKTAEASGGFFSVSFDDLADIRSQAGTTVPSSNIFDINKDGTVSFADVVEARAATGLQLTNIAVP